MNTNFLTALASIAKYGSMAEAARKSGLTHGAIAQQIRALEKELGARLISRAGRTVHLSEKGNLLLEPINQVLAHIEMIRHLAKSDPVKGELKLGAGNSALNTVVPDILAKLIKNYPLIHVFIHPGHSLEFYPAVENGELDAAIALAPPFELPKTLGWRLLREERFVLIAARQHAGKDPHDLLRKHPFIRYERSNWGGRHADDYLKRAGIEPHDRFELNAIEPIAVMVSKNLGVAILPKSTSGFIERLNVVSMELPAPCEPRRFGLIWSRSSPRISLIKTFLDTAIQEYKQLD